MDLKYPEELHDAHNSYPLVPEKKVMKNERMSGYQKRLMADLNLNPPNSENFCKLVNNSVFGRTMENLRNCVDVKIVRSRENDKIRGLVASPSFARFDILGNDLAGIHMHKSKLVLDKPVYTGMTMLEISRIFRYGFFYDHLKAK